MPERPAGLRRTKTLEIDPVAVALQLDGDVLDGRLPGAVDELDRAVQQLAHGERLERPLLEPAHVHQAGRDDLPGVDRGDAGERQEHAAARGHLDDEPDGPGQPFGAHQHDDVTHSSHLVTEGVEHVGPGKARDEHPGPDAAHVGQPRPGTARQPPHRRLSGRTSPASPASTGLAISAALGEDRGMSFSGNARPPRTPTPPQGETVAAYATYLEAQKAVDHLADSAFPVQLVTIVGADLKMVERVTGRLSYPRVALGGLPVRRVVRPLRRAAAQPVHHAGGAEPAGARDLHRWRASACCSRSSRTRSPAGSATSRRPARSSRRPTRCCAGRSRRTRRASSCARSVASSPAGRPRPPTPITTTSPSDPSGAYPPAAGSAAVGVADRAAGRAARTTRSAARTAFRPARAARAADRAPSGPPTAP